MGVEISLGLVDLLSVDQACMAYTGISETIDYRAADPKRETIVDQRAYDGTGRSYKHNCKNIDVRDRYILSVEREAAACLTSKIGSWRNNDFRREGDKGTFDHHEQKYIKVAHVGDDDLKVV